MNRLILIGNGFDLAHGLKTSYHDFMLDYLKDCIEKACYSNKHYVGDRDYYEMWFNDQFLFTISSRSKPNRSIHLGKTITFLDKIKNLYSISDIIKMSNEHNVTISTNKSNSFSSSLLNECITKNWVDIEGMYYEELKKCLKQYNKEKDYNGKASIGNLIHLNSQLNFLKEKLEIYLTKIELSYNKDILVAFKNLLNVRSPYDDLGVRLRKIMILNFNYTKTPNQYLSERDEIINIHGELNNDKNPIIFGYGDEVDKKYAEIEDLNENEFLKHIKSFDYFKTSNYGNLLRFVQSEIFEVFILGHSCGLSDRTMLSTIFENKNCIRIKIYDFRKDKNDYRNKTYEISRHFNNKASMRDKIVPFPECSPMPQYDE